MEKRPEFTGTIPELLGLLWGSDCARQQRFDDTYDVACKLAEYEHVIHSTVRIYDAIRMQTSEPSDATNTMEKSTPLEPQTKLHDDKERRSPQLRCTTSG